MSVNLTKQDIEQFLEYNPNDWNVFPDVTPPEGVLMRVEVENSYGEVSRECAIFQVGVWWKEECGQAIVEFYKRKVKRFRPWE